MESEKLCRIKSSDILDGRYLSGHEVAEADGGEGDEAKVGRVQVGPALPALEQERTHHDVRRH